MQQLIFADPENPSSSGAGEEVSKTVATEDKKNKNQSAKKPELDTSPSEDAGNASRESTGLARRVNLRDAGGL